MKPRFLPLIFAPFLLLSAGHICRAADVPSPEAKDKVAVKQMQSMLDARSELVHDWKIAEYIEIIAAVCTGLLSLAITGLPTKDRPGRAKAVRIFGFFVTAIPLVTTAAFAADYRTMRRAVESARPIIENLGNLLDIYQVSGQQETNKIAIQTDFVKAAGDFDRLSQSLLGDHGSAASATSGTVSLIPFDIAPSVYAQSSTQPPAWVLQTRGGGDASGNFFVGRGEDRDLNKAQQEAYTDAVSKAVAFYSEGAPSKQCALFPLVRRLAVVSDTWLDYERAAPIRYIYFIKMHVSNAIKDIPLGLSQTTQNDPSVGRINSSDEPRDAARVAVSTACVEPGEMLRFHLTLPSNKTGPLSCMEVDLQNADRPRSVADRSRLTINDDNQKSCFQIGFSRTAVAKSLNFSGGDVDVEVPVPSDIKPGTYFIEHIATYGGATPGMRRRGDTSDYWGKLLVVTPQTIWIPPGAKAH